MGSGARVQSLEPPGTRRDAPGRRLPRGVRADLPETLERHMVMDVIGTWRMVRAVARDANGNELPAPYGGQPLGRVVIGADGRMIAVTSDGRRDLPAGATREYGGYCGNYTYD